MMDFSGGAGAASNFDLIPQGQLAWAIVTVRALKTSQAGGQYLDLELTLDDGQPFARRKIFDMVGDPQFAGNSEAYRQMGLIAVTRMLEAGRGAGPNNPAGYQIGSYDQLNGLRVAVKIGVQKGTGGYEDKNRIAEYLTPNPASQSGHKGFEALSRGEFAPGGRPLGAASPNGFGGSAPSAANPSGGGFSAVNGAAGNNPAGALSEAGSSLGFGAPQPQGQTGWGAAGSAGAQPNQTGFASTTPATAPSPSDPGATPSWLAQANAAGG